MVAARSWGRYPCVDQRVIRLNWRDAILPDVDGSMLPYGNGRSYGDSCLNAGGTLLDTRGLNRFIAFDADSGILRCEAGVLLSDLLALIVPQGWFLPVTPGTKFVTVGGAIANDVHGKNHHRAGSFGHHVLGFELLRSDRNRWLCTPTDNADWFHATIGGLGLTGLIVWAEIQLKPIANPWMTTETMRFDTVAEFLSLSQQSEHSHEYTVAWIDSTARNTQLGRGLFMRGNHAPENTKQGPQAPRYRLPVPFTPPISLVNRLTVNAFNALYYRRQRSTKLNGNRHYDPYLYPLDAVDNLNRIYGAQGLLQYQCVVPSATAQESVSELLGIVANSGAASFLSVLKMFGDRPSLGLLSFPRSGVTLALDFPIRGKPTFALLDRMDDIVAAAGGAVYPAKDARMQGVRFRQYFPNWAGMQSYLDPNFSSSFWRRVME